MCIKIFLVKPPNIVVCAFSKQLQDVQALGHQERIGMFASELW